MPIANKLGKVVTYLEGLFSFQVIQSFDYVVLQGHETYENHCTSITKVTMATKLGRIVTYFDWPLPIKSHDLLIAWSFEIT